jgi:Coenzyme PQQ synthesis protein D (PqqD)
MKRRLSIRARMPHNVVCQTFAAETAVLNLETGRYHGLDEAGRRMLELLESSPTVSRAAAALEAESGRPRSEIEPHLLAFCAQLVARGLIELRAEPPDRATAG